MPHNEWPRGGHARKRALHRKAFLALTALMVAMPLIFAGFSCLGLRRGLGPNVAKIELARMDWLAEHLKAHPTQAG